MIPPVKKPPRNEIAQITIRTTAMMYKMFPMLKCFMVINMMLIDKNLAKAAETYYATNITALIE